MKKSTNNLIRVFAFVFVFFSITAKHRHESGLLYKIGNFIHTGFLHTKFFTLFELIVIALLINIVNNYKVKLKFNNGFFLFAFLAFVIRMINPNVNVPSTILGLPLLTNLSEYVFLFTLLVFFSTPFYLNKIIIERIFKDVLRFSFIKAIIVLLIVLFGKVSTVRWGSYAVVLDEGDIQLLFSFLGAILFPLYLLNNKRKYLYLSFLFLGIVFFSAQRSTTVPGLLAVFLIVMTSLTKSLPMAAKKSFSIIALFVIVVPLIASQFPDSKMAFAINRFTGLVVESDETKDVAFSDTGHREQAMLTFLSVWKDSPFFGVGYGNFEDVYLEGQTSAIHNNYASTWIKHGIITLLFYLVFFAVIILQTFQMYKKINKTNYRSYLFRLTALFFLIGYFISAWVMAPNVLGGFRYQIFWILIYIYATRIPNQLRIQNSF